MMCSSQREALETLSILQILGQEFNQGPIWPSFLGQVLGCCVCFFFPWSSSFPWGWGFILAMPGYSSPILIMWGCIDVIDVKWIWDWNWSKSSCLVDVAKQMVIFFHSNLRCSRKISPKPQPTLLWQPEIQAIMTTALEYSKLFLFLPQRFRDHVANEFISQPHLFTQSSFWQWKTAQCFDQKLLF